MKNLIFLILVSAFFTTNAQTWDQAGNTITATSPYLGTDGSSSEPLRIRTSSYTGNNILFQTNGANTRMTILGTNGNVGIGSANPLQLLDIAGNTTISSNSWYGINNARILSNPGTNNIYVGISTIAANSLILKATDGAFF